MIYGYELRKVPGFERLCWVKGDNVTKALTGNHTYLGRYVDEIGYSLKSNGGIQFEKEFIGRNELDVTKLYSTDCRTGGGKRSRRSRRRVTKKARKYSRRK